LAGSDTLRLVGRTIADKYAVESVVGEGGFAIVYRATHLLWKRPVALKVFKSLGEVSEKDRQKLLDEFIQEGALLADLSTRTAAIVQARDIAMLATADGQFVPYMVLEWLEGATLEAVLAQEKAQGLPLRTLSQIMALIEPAAEALALAHRKGIAHRDVKPGNLFVLGDPRGEFSIKLLDFGIAKVVSDAQKMAGTFTKTGGQVTSFTIAYGAPEQFSRTHGSTGPWTDVFALALVLVEAMTGRDPLEGDDFVQLAVASANPQSRPTPRTFGLVVGDAVESVFAKALAVKPADRFQTAGDFWNSLRQALKMEPMRLATDRGQAPVLSSRPPSGHAPTAVATGHALGVGAATPPVTTGPKSKSTTGRPSGSGKLGLFVGLGIGAVVAIGSAVYVVGSKKDAASAPAPPSASVTTPGLPSASAAPSASDTAAARVPARAACPADMIAIPGGSFFMGNDDALPLERPAHQVVLAPYCIDRFEVSVEKYKACSDGGRCKRAGTTNDWPDISAKDHKVFDPLCNVRDAEARAKHPINCVDWEMSDKFCHEQAKRLPTEAEWEFAARGPDGRKYPWGDDDPSAGFMNACGKECVAWGAKNGVDEKAMYDVDDGFATTAPVGSFPKGASRYGVEDVVGNVWEWVADYYGPYSKDEQKAPTGPAQGDERVIRGGSWNASYASWVRPTFRYKDTPSKRSYGIGFRCAL
jgi:formylglycine-generating enzyme required for sulfatase activity/serine/threonine protein kinase